MKKKFKLGIIGCGFTGALIARGVVLSDFLSPKKIIVSDIIEEKLDSIGELGVFTCENNKFVAENSEFLIFAVKPQNFDELIKSLSGFKPDKVISVIPGISKNKIKNSLGIGMVKVARCAPNLPCSIGSGVIGIDMSDFNFHQDDSEFISKVFDCLGTVVSIDESKLDAVSAIGGSGPVYAFMLIDALIDAGVKQGLTPGEAKSFVIQTVLGSAELAQRDEKSVTELLTEAGNSDGASLETVKVLEENNFSETVKKAVDACVKRNKELSLK